MKLYIVQNEFKDTYGLLNIEKTLQLYIQNLTNNIFAVVIIFNCF